MGVDLPKDGFVWFRGGLGCKDADNCFNCPFPDGCHWNCIEYGAGNWGTKYIPESEWAKKRTLNVM